jgi:methylenetetrahydrofolate reductase (NADPH)
MRREVRTALIKALGEPRYEVIPVAGIEDEIDGIPAEVKLTVTSSPTKGIDATLDLTAALAATGFHVVPHLSARLIADEAHLKDILQRLDELKVREVFVVAGDTEMPAGKFSGAVSLLEAMSEQGIEFDAIGVTGYPESHPHIDDDITIQAMWDKRHYATYIVSQICFDTDLIADWVARVRRRGVGLPIYIGMPGVTDPIRLARISRKVGIGESTRFLTQQGSRFLRLLRPGGYAPDRFVERLAPLLADAKSNVAGLHIYTFNEVTKTERWRRGMFERLGEKNTK